MSVGHWLACGRRWSLKKSSDVPRRNLLVATDDQRRRGWWFWRRRRWLLRGAAAAAAGAAGGPIGSSSRRSRSVALSTALLLPGHAAGHLLSKPESYPGSVAGGCCCASSSNNLHAKERAAAASNLFAPAFVFRAAPSTHHHPPLTTLPLPLLLVLCLPVRPQTPFELLLAATSTCPVRATWTNAALVRAASMARVRWPQPPLIVARIHMLPCISRKCGQALCPVSGQAFARAWPFIQTHVTITNSTPRLLVHAHPSIRGTSG